MVGLELDSTSLWYDRARNRLYRDGFNDYE